MASKTTYEIVREQSRKRKRALDLKGKSIEALVEGDFADTETNQEVRGKSITQTQTYTIGW